MYGTILFAHDGSDLAREALPHLRAIAGAFDSTVVLCHVIRPDASMDAHETRIAEGVVYSTRLEAMREELQEAGVTKVETLVLEGVPERALAETAVEREVDLIIVTTHARGSLSRALLGSVSDSLARTTPGIPVLVVHPDEG